MSACKKSETNDSNSFAIIQSLGICLSTMYLLPDFNIEIIEPKVQISGKEFSTIDSFNEMKIISNIQRQSVLIVRLEFTPNKRLYQEV